MFRIFFFLSILLSAVNLFAQNEQLENSYANLICEPPSEFPARKTALLNALPKHTLSKQEVMTFLATLHTDLKKKYPQEPVKHAMDIIIQFGMHF